MTKAKEVLTKSSGGNSRLKPLLSALAAALLLAACGGQEPEVGGHGVHQPPAAATAASEAAGGERKVLYWHDPMRPEARFDKPGKSPFMDMDLVPVYADEAGAAVRVPSAIQQSMGLRTAPARRGDIWRHVRAVGYVGYDEERVHHVHPRAPGWIEKQQVRAAGEAVQKGQVLYEYYAPDIANALQELKLARSTGRELGLSARSRLKLYEVPDSVIAAIEKGGEAPRTVPVVAPASGTVAALAVRHGMYVTPALETYSIADLSEVWVTVEVLEQQMAGVAVGRPAAIRVAALPGRSFEGLVDYLYPEMDPKSRALKVRLRLPNPEGLLRPNMLADAEIFGGPKRDLLLIPREALIETGAGARVIRRLPDGAFQPVAVNTGLRGGESVEILSGLAEGDEVVVSGQFLLDSESSLRASLSRLSGE
jgi:Cu(I)/Ag(I) efflux system membrane fusion protein